MAFSSVNRVIFAVALLVPSVFSFMVAPQTALTRSVSSSTRAPHTSQVLRAQSMEGENLRPDVEEALAEMAREASGTIESLVKENKVMLFMKGNKLFPQCGFSNSAIQVLRACDVEFETYDVLSNAGVREGIKEFSNWPTIPQLYIDGEFTGGADIMIESFQSGELKKMLQDADCTFVATE